MSLQIRKAVRRKAKLRLGIAGPSGAGKTYSALLLAFGMKAGKIGLIDTEHGSGDLYAHLGDYDLITLTPPYTVSRYREALSAFESSGYDIVIIDSISHAWAGEGGLLDKHGRAVDGSKTKDSFSAWRMVTPDHNAFIDAMLSSPCHIIATMRSKTDYVLVEMERNGRKVMTPQKVGMAPIQRDGMEYEFTVMLDLNIDHIASASKDRTGLFDGSFVRIDQNVGARIQGWLDSGEDHISLSEPTRATQKETVIKRISDCTSIESLRAAYEDLHEKATAMNDEDLVNFILGAAKKRKAEIKALQAAKDMDTAQEDALRMIEPKPLASDAQGEEHAQ